MSPNRIRTPLPRFHAKKAEILSGNFTIPNLTFLRICPRMLPLVLFLFCFIIIKVGTIYLSMSLIWTCHDLGSSGQRGPNVHWKRQFCIHTMVHIRSAVLTVTLTLSRGHLIQWAPASLQSAKTVPRWNRMEHLILEPSPEDLNHGWVGLSGFVPHPPATLQVCSGQKDFRVPTGAAALGSSDVRCFACSIAQRAKQAVCVIGGLRPPPRRAAPAHARFRAQGRPPYSDESAFLRQEFLFRLES